MRTDKDRVSDRFPLRNPTPHPMHGMDKPNTHVEISLSYHKGRGYVLDSTIMRVADGLISVSLAFGMLSTPRVMVQTTNRFSAKTFKSLCDRFVPHFIHFAEMAERGDKDGFREMANRIMAGEPVQPRVLPEPEPKARDFSPWGAIDYATRLAEGIVSVSTPSHGGIWLSQARQAEMPAELVAVNFLKSQTWWEEDCDAIMPLYVFRGELDAETRARVEAIVQPGRLSAHVAAAMVKAGLVDDAPARDDEHERAAARARSNDFAETGGRDWT